MQVINQERSMPDRLGIKTRKITLAGNLTLGNKPYRIKAFAQDTKVHAARCWLEWEQWTHIISTNVENWKSHGIRNGKKRIQNSHQLHINAIVVNIVLSGMICGLASQFACNLVTDILPKYSFICCYFEMA